MFGFDPGPKRGARFCKFVIAARDEGVVEAQDVGQVRRDRAAGLAPSIVGAEGEWRVRCIAGLLIRGENARVVQSLIEVFGGLLLVGRRASKK